MSPLDPHLAVRVDALRTVTVDTIADLQGGGRRRTPVEQAALDEWGTDPAPWSMPADVTVTDEIVAGRHGDIPTRRYRVRRPGSTVLWVHGGGFVTGDLAMNESHVVAAEIAHRAQVDVVAVAYHLARDGVRYPVPVDDVADVWTALGTGAAVIGGASAGAALALSVALRAVRADALVPAGVMLAYPFVHHPVPAADDATAAVLAGLPAYLRFHPDRVDDMVRAYVGRIGDLPPEALPGASDLRGLPPTFIVEDEYDDLRPSAELLGRQLSESRVEVTSTVARGMTHGHLNRLPSHPEVESTLAAMSRFIVNRGAGR